MRHSVSSIAPPSWCVWAAVAITLLSLAPQLRFWMVRGTQWQGAYIVLQPDEVLYSAYVNAIIDGRPARNDPSAGQDDNAINPMPESLFSIQFLPAFVVAYLARLFRVSAASAFIALLGFAGLFGSLSVYWLHASISGDKRFAAISVLAVFAFGATAAGQGLIGLLFRPEVKFLGMPFLRRYEPGGPFPLFFLFCTFVWFTFTVPRSRTMMISAFLAGGVFVSLIFSYLYLWTAAIAWIACVCCIWFFLRGIDLRKSLITSALLGAPAVGGLAVYGYLLSRLPSSINETQVVTYTRQPDIVRLSELIGFISILVVVVAVRQGKISVREPSVIFAISFAILPFLLFNQQIVSGRSIQPFHYEVFIGNYVALVGALLLLKFISPEVRRRSAVLFVVFCLFWAGIEVELSFRANSLIATRSDQMVPVLLALKERAKNDGTWDHLHSEGLTPGVVFSPTYGISTILPTLAPQGSLLAPGSASFQNLSETERKEWFFMHLYYCGRDAGYMHRLLNDRVEDPFFTHFARTTLFGPERVVTFLGANFRPIQQEEIAQQITNYQEFAKSFSRYQASKRLLAYAITPAETAFDFSNLDKWYLRDQGIREGDYVLYQLHLRGEPQTKSDQSN